MTFAVVIILVLAYLVKIGSLNEKDLFLLLFQHLDVFLGQCILLEQDI